MASFTLLPCKFREDRFVPSTDQTLTWEWPEVKQRLAPTGSRNALMSLRRSKIGNFIGLMKNDKTGEPNTFLFIDEGRPQNLALHIKKDPTLPDKIIEVYRVERVLWDDTIKESVWEGNQ